MTPTATPPRRVLVVEDNDDSRETLRILLGLWGYEVEVASDGPRGVEKALSWRPDAAVLDIGLPGLDGYEVARRLRKALSGVSLIAWTGYDGREDRRRAHEAGFDYHLTKASDLSTLQTLLAR